MNNLQKVKLTYLLLIISTITSCAVVSSLKTSSTTKPNIILINADDLGIGMLSLYGQQKVKTPHIDSIAHEGMKFNNFYAPVFCAPSRWSLLTGMHDGRDGGWQHNRAGLPIYRDSGKITEAEYQTKMKKVKKDAHPIAPNEVFLAQVAKQAGYKTAQFGKLDRGFLTWNERVKRFGWDFHEGYYDHRKAHGFYPSYIWRNGEKIHLSGNYLADAGKTTLEGNEPVNYGGKTYSQNVFIENILQFIRDNKEQPFFLYHSTQLPHGPVAIPELHPDFVNDDSLTLAEKKYASMVKMLDDHVGLILKELKEQGLDENTIVFFTSDNGHELYYGPYKSYFAQTDAQGKPLNLTDNKWRTSEHGDVFNGTAGRAGLKRSGYQGGIQVPMFVRWPGKIKPGSETNLFAAHYDFMATLADIGEVPTPKGKDSLSYLPTLLGQEQTKKHAHIIIYNEREIMASSTLLTQDGWKLVEANKQTGEFQLYNLNEDNEERFNLASQYPEKVSKLKKILLSELNSERPDLQH